jgi:uncharacterized protein
VTGGGRLRDGGPIFNQGRLRSGWRLLLFILAWFPLSVVGIAALGAVLPPGPSGRLWAAAAGPLLAALAAGWALLWFLDRRRPGALGFAWTRAVPRELGGGLLVGCAGLAVAVAVIALGGWLSYEAAPGAVAGYAGALLGSFAFLAVAAALEEALFRGYPFQVLVEGIGPVAATLAGSALFAAAHMGNPAVGAVALLNIFLAGILLSVAYLRTRSLWFATAVHLGWNWTLAGPFDLPVSGLELFETPLYDARVGGPDWVTGGAFGPEGGLAGTIGFAVALLLVVRLPVFRPAPEMARLEPLVDRRLGDGS